MQPIAEYRAFVERWLRWACGGAGGVTEFDATYRQVTENRDKPGAKPGEPGYYSSCGDLPHAMLEAVGVRSSFVNRKSLEQYRNGWNITKLDTAPATRAPSARDLFKVGDILLTWNNVDTRDAHAMVAIEERQGTGAILLAEYGQPGGHIRSRGISRLGGISIAGKKLRRVLLLEDMLERADSAGELVEVRLDTDTDRAPPPSEPTTIAPPLDPSRLPVLSKGPKAQLTLDYVKLVQRRLNATGTLPKLDDDGWFWALTRSAVISFQRARALNPNGVVDSLTWQELLREVSR
jgi:peptidoglycan hydrolase-like protein with peptidoglycan-binding domain